MRSLQNALAYSVGGDMKIEVELPDSRRYVTVTMSSKAKTSGSCARRQRNGQKFLTTFLRYQKIDSCRLSERNNVLFDRSRSSPDPRATNVQFNCCWSCCTASCRQMFINICAILVGNRGTYSRQAVLPSISQSAYVFVFPSVRLCVRLCQWGTKAQRLAYRQTDRHIVYTDRPTGSQTARRQDEGQAGWLTG